jgi:hypothetical protein
MINLTWLVYYNLQDESSSFVSKNEVTCGRWPQDQDITIDNVIWQVLSIPKGFYKLMNAYLDARQNQTIVRVSVIGDRLNIETDVIYCQFWFDDVSEAQPIVVEASQFVMIWPDSKFKKKFQTGFFPSKNEIRRLTMSSVCA